MSSRSTAPSNDPRRRRTSKRVARRSSSWSRPIASSRRRPSARSASTQASDSWSSTGWSVATSFTTLAIVAAVFLPPRPRGKNFARPVAKPFDDTTGSDHQRQRPGDGSELRPRRGPASRARPPHRNRRGPRRAQPCRDPEARRRRLRRAAHAPGVPAHDLPERGRLRRADCRQVHPLPLPLHAPPPAVPRRGARRRTSRASGSSGSPSSAGSWSSSPASSRSRSG